MNSSTNSFTRNFMALALGAAVLIGGLALASVQAHAQDGSVAPVLSNIASTTTDTGATISWTSDQAGTAQVFYGPTTAYGASSTYDNSTSTTNHTSFLGGLTPNTMYHFEVVTGNASGTMATSSDMTFMTTNTAASTSAPMVTTVVATPTDTGATITWMTDQNANSQIMYGATNAYGNTTALDTASVMSHSEMLTGLTPNTTYHFMVWSTGTGTTTAGTSTDMTFTTTNTASTTASTTAPVLSMVLATPTDTGATITWTTDQNANSQVMYGTTNAYGNTTTLDPTNVMSHSVTLSGLMPNTMYHYQVWSIASGTGMMTSSSTDMTFTTSVSSTTGTSTDPTYLQSEITALQARVSALEAALAAWMSGNGGTGGTGSTTPPTNTSSGILDQSSMSVTAGGSLNFGGRGFPHEENITISLNGMTVGTAHADGGGNFSTGSMSAPTTPGTYTYMFTGSTGDVSSATVTVH